MTQQPSVPLPGKAVPPPPPPPSPASKGGPPAGPGGSPTQDQQPEEILEEAGAGMPPWLDASLPWMVSLTFHLGILLVAIFAIFMLHPKTDDDREPIALPSSFSDAQLNDKEGGIPHPGLNGDPNRDAAQDKLKDILKSDGTAENESKDTAKDLLEGQTAENDALLITSGSGGSIGKGQGGSGQGNAGVMAPYGVPGGGSGSGPKGSFFGNGGRGMKIVYILDHSGSMLDNFDFLRQEAIRSVGKLIPVQKFSVVMVSEVAVTIYPTLQNATPTIQRDFATKLGTFRAQGQNDDLLEPFQEAFEKAFAMKPDLIYFLTDGHFDPRLTAVVDKLNVGKRVQVNTLAFINKEPSYEDQLKDMAKSNKGSYKFVSEKDLGK
jgi:hypothetical protein